MDQTAGDSRTDHRALLAAGVTVVMWASAFVSIRASADHFGPGALALGRLLTASLALGVVLLVKRVPLPPRAAWPGILASGVLWFGLYVTPPPRERGGFSLCRLGFATDQPGP